jgi:hypothetical protein
LPNAIDEVRVQEGSEYPEEERSENAILSFEWLVLKLSTGKDHCSKAKCETK